MGLALMKQSSSDDISLRRLFLCCWYIFQDGRRVVRFLMDVQWGVPWLVVQAVFTTPEVERDVEKVDGRGVRFYGDLEAIFTEDLAYASSFRH